MSDLRRLQRRFPAFFVRLIGGDYQLLLRSGEFVIKKHFLAAIFLLVVMLVSAISVFYATDLLFHFWQAEIALAFFVTGLFACIYVFLITTMSNLTRQGSKLSLSNLVRVGFVLFMAFLISKPIEVLIFSRSLESKVLLYKDGLYQSYEKNLELLSANERLSLKQKVANVQKRIELYPNKHDEAQLDELNRQLSDLANMNAKSLQLAAARIHKSDYFLFRVQQVVKQPGAWIVTLLIMLLFFLPAFLIYSIPPAHAYYQLKADGERNMISEAYSRFLTSYCQIFEDSWGVKVEPYSKYEDPPFNSIRKPEPEYLSNDDFISRYLR